MKNEASIKFIRNTILSLINKGYWKEKQHEQAKITVNVLNWVLDDRLLYQELKGNDKNETKNT